MIKQKRGLGIWITGLAGSGKTTVATAVTKHLRARGRQVVFFDGDQMRAILGNFDYAAEDRRALAHIYSRLFATVVAQGTDVIFATISMFRDVRESNRRSIENYFEVYLRVPQRELRQRDQKKLYSKGAPEGKSLVSLEREFEEPKFADVVVDNYGATNADRAVEAVLKELGRKFPGVS